MKSWYLLLLSLVANRSDSQEIADNLFHYSAKDSIITTISNKYDNKSFLHRLIMGKNYRKTWSTPVKLPVLYLSKTGLKIEELGGGQQTKSLQLVDANGKEWALRTIDKDVTLALPERLRNTIAQKAVQDMISASHPFSHVIVGKLSQAAKIIASMPVIYYVADDPALGAYRHIFANTVCMLETKEPVPVGDNDDTEEVLTKIREENDHLVLQKKILRSRLMDMLVGDWDRHEDQWTWAEKDSAGVKLLYAIPKDRDNALFYSNGVLVKITQTFFVPHFSGFKKKSTGLRKLNSKSWNFDKTFLNGLDEMEWRNMILEFQRLLSDSVIEASVKAIPAPVFALDGENIIRKLKSRRDGLLKNGLDYYTQLSRTVIINGSDEEELFEATGTGDRLKVAVYSLQKDGSRQMIYERIFDPRKTKSISLQGFKGSDQFLIDETASSTIRLDVYGHEGNDVYTVKGAVRSRITDLRFEENTVVDNHAAKIQYR